MFDRIVEKLRGLLVLALLGLAIWIALLVAGTLKDLRTLVQHSDAAVVEAQRRVVDTSQNLNGLIIQLGLTSDQIHQAAIEQRKLTAETTRKTNEALDRANTLIANLDSNINEKLLPEATRTVSKLSGSADGLTKLAADVSATVKALEPTLENLAVASKGAADRMNDPSLQKTLENIERGTKGLAESSENLSAMTADARVALHKALKPANLIWSGFKFIAQWTVNALQAKAGVK